MFWYKKPAHNAGLRLLPLAQHFKMEITHFASTHLIMLLYTVHMPRDPFNPDDSQRTRPGCMGGMLPEKQLQSPLRPIRRHQRRHKPTTYSDG